MKWLKQLLLKWSLHKLRQQVRDASPHKAERALTQSLLELIPQEQLFEIDSNKLAGLSVQTQFTDLESMIVKIKDSIRLIRENKIIASDWLSVPQSMISFDRFITVSNGFYVVPTESIRSFKLNALTLCQLMESSDTETVGLPEHNLRMLTKLFVEIRVLTLLLLQINQTL